MSELRRTIPGLVSLLVLWTLVASTKSIATQPDPTRPPNVEVAVVAEGQAASTSDLLLTSVLVASGRRVAILNGRNVVEGDSIGGAKVVAIRDRSVRLVRNGETIEVSLARTEVKRPVDAEASRTIFLGTSAEAPSDAEPTRDFEAPGSQNGGETRP